LGRLSDPRGPGKMVLAANPGPTDHWVYRRFIDPESAGRYPQTRYIHCTLFDNRENLDERYFQSRIRTEKQNPEYFKRMVLGEWGAFGSKRFKVWNREKHVIDPFKVPQFWEMIEAIDFGYSHPFVCLWVAIDERERYFVVGEHWEKERPAYVPREADPGDPRPQRVDADRHLGRPVDLRGPQRHVVPGLRTDGLRGVPVPGRQRPAGRLEPDRGDAAERDRRAAAVAGLLHVQAPDQGVAQPALQGELRRRGEVQRPLLGRFALRGDVAAPGGDAAGG